ncbi:MAG: polysaccharide deacetylase family protein [Thiohalorhabdus sp.]
MSSNPRRASLLLLFAGLLAGALAGGARAADHAVVLMYHHVDRDTPSSTSVTPETFERHLDYLEEQDFTVWPLVRVLRHLDRGESLPEKTVALTFDDAYESVYTEAFPRLRRRGWPFTVFVSTDYIDKGHGGYLGWDQLRELAAEEGVDLGNHTRSHPHLVRHRDGEDESAWRERVRGEIRGARERLAAEAGEPVPVFAYPYGEYDREVRAIVEGLDLYGVGQQSGPVGAGSDLRAAPRFPVATPYADLDDLGPKLRSRPLPVTVLAPEDRVLAPEAQRPELRLRLEEGPYRAGALACYASGQGRMERTWVDEAEGEVAVRPRESLRPGRTKYNCTAPSAEESGIFYWFSYLWIKPRPDGSWYQE